MSDINKTIAKALTELHTKHGEDYIELDGRIKKLEEAPSNDVNVKKQTLKLYKQLGDANATLKPYTDELRNSVIGLDEFAKLGTGLFIHWGVYAVPAGTYTGPKQEGSTVTATKLTRNCEWIMRDLAIPRNTYKAYQAQFTAENWDPETICQQAVAAKMGYVVITVKHHDGFILYPSEYGDWTVETSAARNTIIDELKAACDKYNLKFGVYISQYWDWNAEGGFGLNYDGKWNGSSADLYTADQHKEYMGRMIKQVNEMIEKYEPFILWYDPGTSYGDTYANMLRQAELNNWPHIIVNDRLDYNRKYGDYGTGERTIYVRNTLPVGEACFTMNNTWGYSENNETDSWYYTHEKVMKEFVIYSLAYGQNCLMNIGPRADGSIPERQIACLQSMGSFFDKYGSVRNYKRYHSTFIPKFGYVLELEGNKLACYVATQGNPSTQEVVIDCVPTEHLESVSILTPNENSSYEISDGKILVHNLGLDSDTKFGVVVLQYSKMITPLAGNMYEANSMVPSRVFVYNKGNMSYDLTNLYYKLSPSTKCNHTTSFIWKGESGNYTLSLNRTRIKASPIYEDDITTVTITDKETNASQSITYAFDVNESELTFALEKGKQYTFNLLCSGTESHDLYRLDGWTFIAQVIIIHPESVTLNHNKLFVEEGGTGLLEATVLPIDTSDPSVTWSSSNTNVATVDEDGNIVGVAVGDAIVTVTTVDSGKTATCHVIVTGATIIDVTDVTLSETRVTKVIGQTIQLNKTITPADATYPQCEWTSSDTSIATVDEYGLVTAVGEGTATITCTAIYNQVSGTCEVVVLPIMPNSISLSKTSVTLIPGFSETLEVTFDPENTTHKEINWAIDNEEIASVIDGVIFAKTPGTAIITATSISGGKTATCALTVNAETYDNIFEAESLTGSADQGTEWNVHPFCDDCTNWTLFGFAQDSRNTPYEEGGARQTDNNATLYQCVVNASPWTGLRIDADNNYYPTATTDKATLYPRLLAGTDHYISPLTGAITTSKVKFSVDSPMHPVCISRNGNIYKSSIDGVNWTVLEGMNSSQIARLTDAIITVGYDYKRSGGQITNTKYRLLRTDNPVCVAMKMESEYPFYTLYHEYDENL